MVRLAVSFLVFVGCMYVIAGELFNLKLISSLQFADLFIFSKSVSVCSRFAHLLGSYEPDADDIESHSSVAKREVHNNVIYKATAEEPPVAANSVPRVSFVALNNNGFNSSRQTHHQPLVSSRAAPVDIESVAVAVPVGMNGSSSNNNSEPTSPTSPTDSVGGGRPRLNRKLSISLGSRSNSTSNNNNSSNNLNSNNNSNNNSAYNSNNNSYANSPTPNPDSPALPIAPPAPSAPALHTLKHFHTRVPQSSSSPLKTLRPLPLPPRQPQQQQSNF